MKDQTTVEPLIQVENIVQTFPTADKPVLSKVNLTIYPGDFLAIIGPSGSGKSTLLNILGLLSTPTSGTYQLAGTEVTQSSEKERDHLRRNTIGFIFQSSNMLLDETSLTNAAMGLRICGVPFHQRLELAQEALEDVGLSHRAHIATKYLSGGEKQRCAIARAIAPRPTLILADEPTGNLDTDNSQKVIEILSELNKAGHTVVIITHDPAIAALAHRRASIVDGVLTEEKPSALPQRTTHLAETPDVEKPSFLADDATEALSSLTLRPLRTALLALSFALGIGGLVAAMGMSESANYQVSQRLLGGEQHTIHATVDTDEDVLSNTRTGRSAADYAHKLNELDYVKSAAYQAVVAPADTRITRFSPLDKEPDTAIGLVTLDSTRLNQLQATVSPEQANTTLDTMTASLTLSSEADRVKATELGTAIVTPKAAEALGLLDSKTGKLTGETGIWVDGTFFPVTGLVDFGDTAPELASAVLVPPQTIALNGKYQTLYTIDTEPGYTRAVSRAVPLILAPTSPANVRTETPSNLADLRAEVSSDMGLFIGILSGILLVLASLSAGTAMYLSVQSRTVEIALRRAIGSSKSTIARLFILEGTCLGLVGGALGAAGGTLATLLLAQAQGWQAILSPIFPLWGTLLGIVTGLVSSIYPAWVASRKNPADAMRD